MRKRRGKLYFFLPLVYLGVLLGFVALQFSKNENFSRPSGELTVTGRAPTGGAEADLLDIQIRGRGMEFVFSAQKPLIVQTPDGTLHKLRPLDHDAGTVKDKVTVTFQQKVQLVFETTPNSLIIRPILKDALAGAVRVRIPYAGESGSKVVLHPYLPLAEIQKGNRKILLSAPGGSEPLEADGVSLGVRGGWVLPALITAAGTSDSSAQWLDTTLENRWTPEQFEGAFGQYLTQIYTAWKTTRFQSGVWDMGDGLPRFNGPVAAALMEEALVRGEYPQVYDQLAPYLPYNMGNWGMEAVPFLGDLMGNFAARRQILDQMALSMDTRGVVDLAGRPRTVADAFFLGNPGVGDKILKYLLTADLNKRSYREMVLVLWSLAMAVDRGAGTETAQRRDAVVKSLVSRLVKTPTGVFCESAQGNWDLRSGMILGGTLLKIHRQTQDPGLKTLGMALIQSALAYKSESGTLPETLLAREGKVIQQEGRILGEELQPFLRESPTKDLVLSGDGVTAVLRGAAGLVEKTVNAQGIKLTFSFPVGYSQHFIIQGLEPFDSIFLHEIRWRSDPSFQIYNDGWFYNPTTKTLFVKLKQKAEKEVFQLSFVPEAPK